MCIGTRSVNTKQQTEQNPYINYIKSKIKMKKAFFVEYNAKFVAMYRSVKACLNFISRKGYVNDLDNLVRIFDNDGNEYHTINGNLIENE
jgi:hypothetical protein